MAAGFVNSQLDDLYSKHNAQASQINDLYTKIVPAGTIAMWSGSIGSIPSGWRLCDGGGGTPNLVDRFIVGAGGSYGVGNTGGAVTVTLTESQIPPHQHRFRSGGNRGPGGSGREPAGWLDPQPNIHNTEVIGGGQPHENRPPYYALCYIMKL